MCDLTVGAVYRVKEVVVKPLSLVITDFCTVIGVTEGVRLALWLKDLTMWFVEHSTWAASSFSWVVERADSEPKPSTRVSNKLPAGVL